MHQPESKNSFSREFRIKSRKDFLRIQSDGKKERSYNFLLCALHNPTDEISRIGITVTTKINKRANERNRIKRQVREFFRARKNYLSWNLDIVIIALNGASELTNSEIREQLNFLFKKTGILTNRREPDCR